MPRRPRIWESPVSNPLLNNHGLSPIAIILIANDYIWMNIAFCRTMVRSVLHVMVRAAAILPISCSITNVVAETLEIRAAYLSEAVAEFSGRHRVCVTYEEPAHVFSGDFEDIAPSIYPNNRVRGSARFQPMYVGRPLDLHLEYELDPLNVTSQTVTAALSKMLSEYNAGDYPGKFRLQTEPGVWHVIPEKLRDARGVWQDVHPFLDQEVEFPTTNSALFDLVFTVMDPLTKAAGWPRFGFGANALARRGGMNGPLVELSAHRGTVRDFITDITTRKFENITWQLWRQASERPGGGRPLLHLTENTIENAAMPPRPPRTTRQQPPTQNASYVDNKLNPVRDAKSEGLYRLNVEGERPLQLALQGFMQVHRVAITYEDPFYENLDAMVDRTAERKDLNKFPPGKAPRVLDPKETRFQADYELGSTTDDQIDAALRQIVEQYNSVSQVAHFRVQKGPGCWHVIPDKVRDTIGHWRVATNQLDAKIRVEGGETNIARFVESALKLGHRNPAASVWMFADIPPLIVNLPAGDYVVRELLAQLLADNFIDLAWSVAQDPSDPPAGGAVFQSFWLPLVTSEGSSTSLSIQ